MSKIIVVDDEKNIREGLKEILENDGHEVSVSEDGKAAIESFKENDYDLIISDIKMPGIDGIEALQEIKKIKPNVKVILITGLPDEETIERASAITDNMVEAFITKPFKPKDLREKIKNVLEGEKYESFDLTEKQKEMLNNFSLKILKNIKIALEESLKIKTDFEDLTEELLKITEEESSKDKNNNIFLAMKFSGDLIGGIYIKINDADAKEIVSLIENQNTGTIDLSGTQAKTALKLYTQIILGGLSKTIKDERDLIINFDEFYVTDKGIIGFAEDIEGGKIFRLSNYIYKINTKIRIYQMAEKNDVKKINITDSSILLNISSIKTLLKSSNAY